MAIKVLVVEDDSFLLNAYRAKFTKAGFELRAATDGEGALEILKIFRPDVIVLDLVMPRKDGFTTLQEIKAQPALKDIPVIVATNLGQKTEVERVLSLGATECISKSNMSLEDLVQKVERLAKH